MVVTLLTDSLSVGYGVVALITDTFRMLNMVVVVVLITDSPSAEQ